MMNHLLTDYYHKNIDDLVSTYKEHCTNQDYIAEIDKKLKEDVF